MSKRIKTNLIEDGIDRRGFLECMAWAGSGMMWTVGGGLLSSRAFGAATEDAESKSFTFVQISDSHIGFNKEANKDVTVTLQQAISKINALQHRPDFLIHTGDLTHLSKPSEFDTLDQVLQSANAGQRFFVPGEHDVISDDGAQYRERYGRGTKGAGWYSFDHKGVHFIGLVNVMNLKPGGLGTLGEEQLRWLKNDLDGRSASTPIVIFAHVPLWSVYPEWGWGTDDAAQALTYMKRFGSVTVLNGHVHQTLQKIEANVRFHTAMSTAFPQPKPGAAASPGPMKVPAEQLCNVLGIATVEYIPGQHALAVIDSTLTNRDASAAGQQNRTEIKIDNFSFAPAALSVRPGATITWTNHDDVPHTVTSSENKFSSGILDTDETFSFTFKEPGWYPYYCKLHPKMTAVVTVAR